MQLDTKRIDQAVLALLYLGLHDGERAWKGFDWDAMNRLHQQGYISDPVGKAKSVVFTTSGLRESERLWATERTCLNLAGLKMLAPMGWHLARRVGSLR